MVLLVDSSCCNCFYRSFCFLFVDNIVDVGVIFVAVDNGVLFFMFMVLLILVDFFFKFNFVVVILDVVDVAVCCCCRDVIFVDVDAMLLLERDLLKQVSLTESIFLKIHCTSHNFTSANDIFSRCTRRVIIYSFLPTARMRS